MRQTTPELSDEQKPAGNVFAVKTPLPEKLGLQEKTLCISTMYTNIMSCVAMVKLD